MRKLTQTGDALQYIHKSICTVGIKKKKSRTKKIWQAMPKQRPVSLCCNVISGKTDGMHR